MKKIIYLQKNYKQNILKLSVFVFNFCLLFLMFSNSASAVVLYLDPEVGEYYPGDTLIVTVRLDTQGDCINVVEVDLGFSKEMLTVEDFSEGGSILTHWIKKPGDKDLSEINNKGMISFAGGIPGGFCGRLAGDPGLSNILGKVIFKIPSLIIGSSINDELDLEILPSSKVFLHDGYGTRADLYVQKARYVVLEGDKPSTDEWEEKLAMDDILPEPFVVELQQSPAIFDGQYFVIFWTSDKQTGIDYFQVKEGDGDFKIATSPYLLDGQTLKNKIIVKAVDKAGNERIVGYTPSEYRYVSLPEPIEQKFVQGWVILVVLASLGIVVTLIKRVKEIKASKLEQIEQKEK